MEPLTRDDPGEIAGYRIRARLRLMTLTRSGPNGMNMAWQDATDQHNVATGQLTRTVPHG
jgi:hypothetical protein